MYFSNLPEIQIEFHKFLQKDEQFLKQSLSRNVNAHSTEI
jgi:hypothetical protein